MVWMLGSLRGYLGAEEVIEISAEYQEFGDERHRKSVEAAHREAARAAERLVRRFNPLADYAAAC